MILQVLALLACLCAALLQFAALRSPDTCSTPVVATGRKINIVSMVIAVIYLGLTLVEGAASNPGHLVLGLTGLSQMLFASNCLLPHMEKGHPKWTSHLNSSR